MRGAFKVFDMDVGGFISAAELQEAVFSRLGLPEASRPATVSDGRVDFGEFKCMMLESPSGAHEAYPLLA